MINVTLIKSIWERLESNFFLYADSRISESEYIDEINIFTEAVKDLQSPEIIEWVKNNLGESAFRTGTNQK